MEVKDLFDHAVKQDILERINKLNNQSTAKWGKMSVGQMLAHCQMPLGVGLGVHTVSRSFLGRLFGPLIKPMIYNNKPFKQGLPTDKSFVMKDPKDFEKEKQALIRMIKGFNETSIVNKVHPIFGKMTKEQWSKGTWKHLDHHLQQFGV